MNDRPSKADDTPTIASILAVAATKLALKSVICQWTTRDNVEIANDARMLRELLGEAADQRCGGKP